MYEGILNLKKNLLALGNYIRCYPSDNIILMSLYFVFISMILKKGGDFPFVSVLLPCFVEKVFIIIIVQSGPLPCYYRRTVSSMSLRTQQWTVDQFSFFLDLRQYCMLHYFNFLFSQCIPNCIIRPGPDPN